MCGSRLSPCSSPPWTLSRIHSPARRPAGHSSGEPYDSRMATPLASRCDWLAANPPASARLTATLAGVSERARHAEDLRQAVRAFLDEFAVDGDDRSADESRSERPVL